MKIDKAYYDNLTDEQLFGRMLMLADGLGTHFMTMYFSQAMDKKSVGKFIKIDGYAKRYVLSNGIISSTEKINRDILSAFCKFYEDCWEDVYSVIFELEFSDSVGNNLEWDLSERKRLFSNFKVESDVYINEEE